MARCCNKHQASPSALSEWLNVLQKGFVTRCVVYLLRGSAPLRSDVTKPPNHSFGSMVFRDALTELDPAIRPPSLCKWPPLPLQDYHSCSRRCKIVGLIALMLAFSHRQEFQSETIMRRIEPREKLLFRRDNYHLPLAYRTIDHLVAQSLFSRHISPSIDNM